MIDDQVNTNSSIDFSNFKTSKLPANIAADLDSGIVSIKTNKETFGTLKFEVIMSTQVFIEDFSDETVYKDLQKLSFLDQDGFLTSNFDVYGSFNVLSDLEENF